MAAKKEVSIRRRLLILSVALFALILTVGSAVFFIAMRNIIRNSVDHELTRTLEIERIKLEGSVSGEIALVLKLARSPLIQTYFANPGNPELRKLAFTEISAYREAFRSRSIFWVNDIDKLFYSDDNEPYWVDTGSADNYWYNMTLYKTEVYNFNINYNPDLGVTKLWINAPVFDGGRKPIGMLGTGIDLSAFTEAIYASYTGKADIYFFNAFDEITGAKNTELVAQKKKIDAVLDIGLAKEISAIAKGLGKEGTKTISAVAGEISITAVPTLEWYAFAVRPITRDDYNTPMTAFFVVVLAIIALIFVVFNVYIFGMETSVKRLTRTFAVGDLELNVPYALERKEELDEMSGAIHKMMERIRIRETKLVQASAVTAAGLRFDLFIKEAQSVPQAFKMTSALLHYQYKSVKVTLVYPSDNDFYALSSRAGEDGERTMEEAGYFLRHSRVMQLLAGKKFVFLNGFMIKEQFADFAEENSRIVCLVPIMAEEEIKGYIIIESAQEENLPVVREEAFLLSVAGELAKWIVSFETSRKPKPRILVRRGGNRSPFKSKNL